MGFLKNKMSRDGKVQNAFAKLRMRHKKDRDANSNSKSGKNNNNNSSSNNSINSINSIPASMMPSNASDASVIAKNSKAELDAFSVPTTPTNIDTRMPSVAEWLLWGDEDDAQKKKKQQSRNTIKTTTNVPIPLPPKSPKQRATRSIANSSSAATSKAAIGSRAAAARRTSQNAKRAQLASPLLLAESASFDNSQLDSHFYSEFTDDYTVDTFGDVTLASSKEPGLFTHGLMAVGELITGAISPATTPATASATTTPKRNPRQSRSQSHRRAAPIGEEYDEADDEQTIDSSQHYSQYAKENALPLTKDEDSLVTATTASTSPSHELCDNNSLTTPSGTDGGTYRNVNIVESSQMGVELSLEMITRIEI